MARTTKTDKKRGAAAKKPPASNKPKVAPRKATASDKRKAAPARSKKSPTARATRTKVAASVRKLHRHDSLGPEAHTTARAPADRPAARPSPARPPRDRSEGGSRGLREMSWSHIDAMARELAHAVNRTFQPELVVGVVKGGVYAGREVAAGLRAPFVPVRLHARSRDTGLSAEASIPRAVRGKRVLVVDDIAGTGATLRTAIDKTLSAGATEVRTCTLVVREQGWRPDWFGLETSDLVVFPWDYEPSAGAAGHPGDEYGV